MFWIFGGGLKYGHAGQELYDGSNLAASQDVVVVTINYRTNGVLHDSQVTESHTDIDTSLWLLECQ